MMALELDPEHAGAHEYLENSYLMRDQKMMLLKMLSKLESLVGKNVRSIKIFSRQLKIINLNK